MEQGPPDGSAHTASTNPRSRRAAIETDQGYPRRSGSVGHNQQNQQNQQTEIRARVGGKFDEGGERRLFRREGINNKIDAGETNGGREREDFNEGELGDGDGEYSGYSGIEAYKDKEKGWKRFLR